VRKSAIPIAIGTAGKEILLYLNMNFRLEICVDSVESAIIAQNADVDRVELCANLSEGGTTPGLGTILSARENLGIGLHVIIRPRGGDFLYTDLEYDIMRREIDICGESGVNGIVLGILEKDGDIDVERTARLIEFARPMSATFHRAFDMCADPIKGLEDVISSGAERLLTSGLKNKAVEGMDIIRHLVRQAGTRIIVMPGSGINELNIGEIARTTGAKEFHLTGRKAVESEMVFRREDISIGGTTNIPEFLRKVADTDKLKRIINILRNI
jgi:copper homeostasis protein